MTKDEVARLARIEETLEEFMKQFNGPDGWFSRIEKSSASNSSRIKMIFVIGGSLATFMLGIAGTTIAALLLEWFYIMARYPQAATTIEATARRLLNIQ